MEVSYCFRSTSAGLLTLLFLSSIAMPTFLSISSVSTALPAHGVGAITEAGRMGGIEFLNQAALEEVGTLGDVKALGNVGLAGGIAAISLVSTAGISEAATDDAADETGSAQESPATEPTDLSQPTSQDNVTPSSIAVPIEMVEDSAGSSPTKEDNASSQTVVGESGIGSQSTTTTQEESRSGETQGTSGDDDNIPEGMPVIYLNNLVVGGG